MGMAMQDLLCTNQYVLKLSLYLSSFSLLLSTETGQGRNCPTGHLKYLQPAD